MQVYCILLGKTDLPRKSGTLNFMGPMNGTASASHRRYFAIETFSLAQIRSQCRAISPLLLLPYSIATVTYTRTDPYINGMQTFMHIYIWWSNEGKKHTKQKNKKKRNIHPTNRKLRRLVLWMKRTSQKSIVRCVMASSFFFLFFNNSFIYFVFVRVRDRVSFRCLKQWAKPYLSIVLYSE